MLETHDSSATQHMVAPETKGFLKLLCSGNRQCPPELFEKIWPAERTLVGLRVSKSLRQLLFTNVRRMSFVRSKDAEVNEKLLMKAFSHSKNFHRTAPLEVALEWRGQLCGLNCAVRCAVSGTNLTLLKVTPYNGLGAKGAEGLANALSECTSLTRLELGAGHIGDAGTEKLAMVVGNSKAMTHLDLEANCIGFKGAERLAKVLGGCTALVQLNLNENSLGAAGMPSLSTALADCKALAFLYLRGNLFGDAGAESLAKVLRECKALSVLDVGRNRIGNAGASSLAEAVGSCSALIYLDLTSNEIGAQGVRLLGAGLTKRVHLNFSSNRIDAAELQRLGGRPKWCYHCPPCPTAGLLQGNALALDDLHQQGNAQGWGWELDGWLGFDVNTLHQADAMQNPWFEDGGLDWPLFG